MNTAWEVGKTYSPPGQGLPRIKVVFVNESGSAFCRSVEETEWSGTMYASDRKYWTEEEESS